MAVLEAGDGVGGRVRTDVVDGYLLDRGFQVFLTGYPAAREEIDFDSLQLKPFYAGALIRWQSDWHRCGAFCALDFHRHGLLHAACSRQRSAVQNSACNVWAQSG